MIQQTPSKGQLAELTMKDRQAQGGHHFDNLTALFNNKEKLYGGLAELVDAVLKGITGSWVIRAGSIPATATNQ